MEIHKSNINSQTRQTQTYINLLLPTKFTADIRKTLKKLLLKKITTNSTNIFFHDNNGPLLS